MYGTFSKIVSTNFSRGNEIRNGGVGIFAAKKWIEKVLEVKRVSHRLMMIKLHANKRTAVVVSGYFTSTRPY